MDYTETPFLRRFDSYKVGSDPERTRKKERILARIVIDRKFRSAMLDVGDGNSVPLYWYEPHQFLGGLSIWMFDLFKNQKMELEVFLASLGTMGQVRAWHDDLHKSGLVSNINRVLRSSGLDDGLETPVGSRHQLIYCTLLYFICRSSRPATVIETGVGAGTSSSFILQALNDNEYGELYSIERLRDWYTGVLVDKEVRNRWHLLFGKSIDNLPKLVEKLQIDIFVHDSEHTNRNMLFEYGTAWPKIKESGYLLSDDIISNFSFYKFIGTIDASVVAVVDGFGIVRKTDRGLRT
jgi:predicted O-methyltransferase YrrM